MLDAARASLCPLSRWAAPGCVTCLAVFVNRVGAKNPTAPYWQYFENIANSYIFAKSRVMEYRYAITEKMKAVSDILFDAFVGMDNCISDTGRNLIVEVPKNMCDEVRTALKQKFQDVALIKNAYPMIDDLHDFILVKPMITESPVFYTEGVSVPELEKLLVDQDSDKEYASLDDAFIQKEFQRAFELYPVNTSRLLRYAGRKGKKEEIQSRIGRIDQGRIDIIRYIQSYFLEVPVEKAWLFGSFSRMEENADSDIDILVNLDRSVPLGLLDFARMTNSLENLLKRKVDLVEESSVKPFAAENINREKVLIYERT